MYRIRLATSGLILTILAILANSDTTNAQSRTWTDSTGRYTVDGELLAKDESTVVLQKEDKSLLLVDIASLSASDRELLESDELQQKLDQAETGREFQLRNGLKFQAAVVEYGKRTISIRRRRGKVYVNDKQFDNILPVYQKLIPRIVSHFENIDLRTNEDLEDWVQKLGSKTKSYECEGVMLELPTGDLYAVPFFLLSADDQKYLKPGWEAWIKTEEESRDREDNQLALRASMLASQREQMAAREVVRLHLMLQAASAGATDLWNVTLIPPGGYPKVVVVAAQNSQAAQIAASRQFPQCQVGGVAKKH
ncbi:MAG: hypothetical protein KDB22_21575 [Planctomycetales bacterium]|nr:hypothetical protein [Planctomycetales bacterium]